MNKTGFVWHERYMWHNTGNYGGQFTPIFPVQPFIHYEEPETKRRLKNLLDATGVIHDLINIPPRAVTDEELLLVHSQAYLDSLPSLNDQQRDLDGSTPLFGDALTIARLAAGGAISAVAAICEKQVQNAYALIRPPGHHAESGAGMGFCIFNNAAIAARYAQKHYGIQKVAFIDWDVHHGNGTQEIFWQDPNVLTISIHQDDNYPQDGGYGHEIGAGAGIGRNINIPLPPGSGFGAYEYAFSKIITPALHAFKPDLIIIPSGFDAGAEDPLGRMMMHSEGYRKLTKNVMDVADKVCEGRLLITHEGGYNAITVPFFGLAVIETLLGHRYTIFDPTQEAFEKLGGQSLQAHQKQLIDELYAYLKNVSGSLLA